jgi:hypothetical protein
LKVLLEFKNLDSRQFALRDHLNFISETIMAFINEFIPESDITKYGIVGINTYYFKSSFQPHWTIDRERDIYLRQVATGREEFADARTFTLYWKGTLIEARLLEDGGVGPGGKRWSEFKLNSIATTEGLTAAREDILSDLKEALIAYNGGGVYSSGGVYKTTFNF